MRFYFFIILYIGISLSACNNTLEEPINVAPAVTLKAQRLDSIVFNIDTLHFDQSITAINKDYPFVLQVLSKQILGLDSTHLKEGLISFIRAYDPIFKEANRLNVRAVVHPKLEVLFSRVKFYFPKYALPNTIIYFIGPLEGYGNTLGENYMAIGLQLALGANSPWYQSEQIQKIYPPYISNNFKVEAIPIFAAKNILQDIAPINRMQQDLMEQMIEAGKRQFILKKMLPTINDALLFGYSETQYKGAVEEVETCWNYILKMNLSYSKDPTIIHNFLSEGPFSAYFGHEVPSNIGAYIGYQIVTSWMKEQSTKGSVDFSALLSKPAAQLFAESKYHPY